MDEKPIVCVTVQRGTASGDSYEAARSLDQHLTFNKATDFFKKRKVEFGKAQMRTLHLIGEDDTYTNLAFLLSEQCTHMIKLAVFEGSKKSVFQDRRELSGSLLEQMEEALSVFLKTELNSQYQFPRRRTKSSDYL